MATVNQLCEWVDVIIRSGKGLTIWEDEFIASMMTKIEMYGDRVKFSDKQAEIIERIYAEKTPNG